MTHEVREGKVRGGLLNPRVPQTEEASYNGQPSAELPSPPPRL